MIAYLRLELARTLRDGRYLVLAIGAPVGFYLLFASIFGTPSRGGANTTFDLSASVEIMVAMATFGAMWGALSATAPRLAQDREGGWLDYLATTPFRPWRASTARVVAGLAVAALPIVSVGLTALVAHHVRLGGWQWLAGFLALWLGATPFVALGVAIGSLTTSAVAYALSTALYFVFAALGGLWVPPGVLSPTLRHIASALPSYNQAALGWHIAHGTAPSAANWLVLVAWTAGFAALPWLLRWNPRRAGASAAPPTASDADDAIRLRGIAKHFGPVTAVDGLDLGVRRGEMVALLGPNGSGKSTTVAILLGLLTADGGDAQLFGSAPSQATRAGLAGTMLQDATLMTGVRVGPLLQWVRRAYPDPLDLATITEMIELDSLLGRRTDRLSGGQAQRVRFALAAAGGPQLLILDEPTTGMDVEARRAFWAALHRLQDRGGVTVVFSTHHLDEAEANANRIVVVRAGQIVADGTPDEIRATAGMSTGQVRFRLLHGDPADFRRLPGVTEVLTDGNHLTLTTTDADSTLWAIYDHRDAVAHVEVRDQGLEDAFLHLTSD